MTRHAERFTGRVEDYERYRLRYPASVVDVLRERCHLCPEYLVADIGAGTGMLAEVLLQAGNPVIAIEPNAEMRAACSRLVPRYAKLQVLDGAAEATGLTAASIDLVVVGRAFHWFDRERALEEFKRILKPARWVVLVSNRRDREGSERNREYDEILARYGNDYSAVRSELRTQEALKPYGKGDTFIVRTPGQEQLTLAEFLGQTQSLSVTPLPGQPNYEAMQHALTGFYEKWSEGDQLTLNTSCELIGWRTSAS